MEESFERRTHRTNMDVLLANPDHDEVRRECWEMQVRLSQAARGLHCTNEALEGVSHIVRGERGYWTYRRDEKGRWEWWHHGLTMALLLSDLKLPLSTAELDNVLAASLCHVVREILTLRDPRAELPCILPMNDAIWDAVMHVTGDSGWSVEEHEQYYAELLEDLPGLLAKLAGRGDVVGRLSHLPLEESMRLARETRKYFLPLCVRAQERYTDLNGPIGILMGKLRCLVTVADILDQRFAGQEKELEAEILDLSEDNVRLQRMIRKLEAQC